MNQLACEFRQQIQIDFGDGFFCQPRWGPTSGLCSFYAEAPLGQCPIRMIHGSTPLALQFPMCSESLLPSKPFVILTSLNKIQTLMAPMVWLQRETLWTSPLPVVLTKLFPMSHSTCPSFADSFFVEDDSSALNIPPHLSSTPSPWRFPWKPSLCHGAHIRDPPLVLTTSPIYRAPVHKVAFYASNVCVSMSLNCENGRGGMDTVFSISVFIGLCKAGTW